MNPPAFQFYPGDFVLGTSHMTSEEVGAYVLLLCFQWNAGSIPNDADTIRRIGRANPSLWLDTVLEKFDVHPDGLKNARLERERAKQIEYRLKQSENGAKGGRPPKGLANPSLSSGLSQTKAKKSSSVFSLQSSSSISDLNSVSCAKSEKADVAEATERKGLSKLSIVERKAIVELVFTKTGIPPTEVDRFIDYYESNGWRVGRNPMRSIDATARNWARNYKSKTYDNSNATGNRSNGKSPPDRHVGMPNAVERYQQACMAKMAREAAAREAREANAKP